jgi:hypothetical protein
MFAIIAAVLGLFMFGWYSKGAQTQNKDVRTLRNETRAKAELKSWKYPGSKELAIGAVDHGRYVQWSTDDPLEKVFAFYSKKMAPMKFNVDKPGAGIIKQEGRWISSFQDDSVEALDPKADRNPERPVTVRVLVEDGAWGSVVVVISRAKEEAHTHIALTSCLPVSDRGF